VATKLVERLLKSYSVTRAQAVQIVNVAPITTEELKSILDTKSSSFTDEQMIEIVDLVIKNRS
jgi:DNA-directed RNA polymerase subunit F